MGHFTFGVDTAYIYVYTANIMLNKTQSSSQNELHVIFGTGSVARFTAVALIDRGYSVRFVSRRGLNPCPTLGAEARVADATNLAASVEAATGAAVVYDCTNPPYDKWPTMLPALTRSVLAVAEATGARLVQAGNLYMYGKAAMPMTEQTPSNPCSIKGELRAMLADEALQAHRAGRVRVVIGRASDFYGPTDQAVLGNRGFRAIAAGKPVDVLGNPDKLHSYTFVPDFGAALALLGTHAEAFGRVWHVPTAPAMTTRNLVELAAAVIGRKPKVRPLSRGMAATVGVFVPAVRSLREMLYQFESDFVLDSSEFTTTFGMAASEPSEAIRRTCEELGLTTAGAEPAYGRV